ncbi:MAG TPA: hypothetical protein VH120_10195 [Gemmataceae bacterium]|jgi:hypothetical protein|nr:hypothetical protein [Gemmataceae bacterium]
MVARRAIATSGLFGVPKFGKDFAQDAGEFQLRRRKPLVHGACRPGTRIAATGNP